jgi:DNA primase
MPGIDYPQLRRQITMRDVLDRIGFEPTWRRGPQLRGACPIPGCCSTSGRSFSVHLVRQVYRCFACGKQGNALDLWAAVRGLSLHHAALDLCRAMNLEPPWLFTSHLTRHSRPPHPVPSRAP